MVMKVTKIACGVFGGTKMGFAAKSSSIMVSKWLKVVIYMINFIDLVKVYRILQEYMIGQSWDKQKMCNFWH